MRGVVKHRAGFYGARLRCVAFSWWRGRAARRRWRSPRGGTGSPDPTRWGSCSPNKHASGSAKWRRAVGRQQTCAYLEEVHARTRDPAGEGLQLHTPLVAVDWDLVCHRRIPRPLCHRNKPSESARYLVRCARHTLRTLTLRMILPRPSTLSSWNV